MGRPKRTNDEERKIKLIERRIKNRKFQRESIYKCIPRKIGANKKIRHVNDKTWDVILFIAFNAYSSTPLTASDIYLGTGLPKRTVIRILDRLEDLNVVEKKADTRNGRVTRIGFSDAFAAEIDNHLQECLGERI